MDSSEKITVIEASGSHFGFKWRELWECRDLILLLAKRDVSVVYKQTVLGPLWFMIQPVIMAAVYSVIFGRVAKIPTDGVPQMVFYLSGTVVWNLFQSVFNSAGSSLFANSALLSKVYFPRLAVPISTTLSNLVFFAFNMAVFLFFCVWHIFRGDSVSISWWALAFPVLVVYAAVSGMGMGLWVAAVTTKYRDLRFSLPFLLQIWMFASPVVYPLSCINSDGVRMLYWVNPVTVAIEANRLMFVGQSSLTLNGVFIGVCSALIVFVSGLLLFDQVQRNFVDTV